MIQPPPFDKGSLAEWSALAFAVLCAIGSGFFAWQAKRQAVKSEQAAQESEASKIEALSAAAQAQGKMAEALASMVEVHKQAQEIKFSVTAFRITGRVNEASGSRPFGFHAEVLNKSERLIRLTRAQYVMEDGTETKASCNILAGKEMRLPIELDKHRTATIKFDAPQFGEVKAIRIFSDNLDASLNLQG